jgi:hypothetical protein
MEPVSENLTRQTLSQPESPLITAALQRVPIRVRFSDDGHFFFLICNSAAILLNRQLNTQKRHAGLDPASTFPLGFRRSPE